MGDGRKRMQRCELLMDAPEIADAWANGEISAAHIDLLQRVRKPATEEKWKTDLASLLEKATRAKYATFRKTIAYWYEEADPNGAEYAAAKKADGRRFHLSQSIDDIWFGNVQLDPIAGYAVKQEIDRIERELYREETRSGEISRTSVQRRPDALVVMAQRSRRAPADGRLPAPLFQVLVGEQSPSRLCELWNGTVVTPGQLLPWFDQAYVEHIVFETPSRVIDVGETRRFFEGATRKAVLLGGRGCYQCDSPLDKCEADHIVPYSKGGRTLVENGRPACGFHNRLRNRE